MIRKVETGIDGKQVTRLIPETQADLEELQRKKDAGLLNPGNSFGDYHQADREAAAKKRKRAS